MHLMQEQTDRPIIYSRIQEEARSLFMTRASSLQGYLGSRGWL